MNEAMYNPEGAPVYAPQVNAPRILTAVNSEVKALDENSTMDFTNTKDELPKAPPLPNGVYDAKVDTVKVGTSARGNLTVTFCFKVIAPENLVDRLIFWNITPGTEFGAVRLKQLLSRSLTTNAKGETITLLERAGKIVFKDFADSGVAIGAITRLTVKQKPGVDQFGAPTIHVNVTDVALPRTNTFM